MFLTKFMENFLKNRDSRCPGKIGFQIKFRICLSQNVAPSISYTMCLLNLFSRHLERNCWPREVCVFDKMFDKFPKNPRFAVPWKNRCPKTIVILLEPKCSAVHSLHNVFIKPIFTPFGMELLASRSLCF